MKRAMLSTIAGLAAFAAAGSAGAQEQQFISIGTGGVTGVYYPAGGAVCRLVNANRDEHGLRCSVESTGGSVYNVNALRAGDLDFGVAQSDMQSLALNGEGDFDEPFENLRAVFALHPEPFTVVARADAEIENFEDLAGKRVNIGNPGSGQRALMDLLMERYEWTEDDFEAVSELRSAEQSQALCDNNIDAFVFSVGHPSGSIQEAATTCDVRLVNVEGDVVDQLVEENDYYATATVPGGTYRGTDEDITTFGVLATLVTSSDVDEEAVYQVTKAVFDNFDDFRGLHPAFAELEKEAMIQDGLSADLHAGARRYYEEEGLLQE